MRTALLAIVTFTNVLVLTSCDPTKSTYQLFAKQGLNLLKPARSYVTVGGFFVYPKTGVHLYVDMQDEIPASKGTLADFSSIILEESKSQTVGIQAAVGTLGSIVPLPAGLKFTHDQQIKLGQIDTGGSRYTTQQVQALLGMENTSKSIGQRLDEGSDVYLVQEVYTSTAMDVVSSSGTGIAAAVYGSPSLPICGAGGGTTTSDVRSAATTDPAVIDGSQSVGDNQGKKGNKVVKKVQPATSTESVARSASSSPKSDVGISVGVCFAGNSVLRFKSKSPLPFAVRLNQIERGPGGTLRIKYKGFTPPPVALGGERANSVLIDAEAPVIGELTHVANKM